MEPVRYAKAAVAERQAWAFSVPVEASVVEARVQEELTVRWVQSVLLLKTAW